MVDLATQAHKKFDSHYHLGHYVIKDNRVYSRMIGKVETLYANKHFLRIVRNAFVPEIIELALIQ